MTAAAPKIADLPSPRWSRAENVDAEDRQLVFVDFPGLIEGAPKGPAGHDFLAHVERCKLLVHVLDLAPLDGSDPVEKFETIENELAETTVGSRSSRASSR